MTRDPMSGAAKRIELVDVTLRDGLQLLKRTVPTAAKLELLEALAAAGVRRAEVGSFVNPKLLPQFNDTPEVLAAARRLAGLSACVLVPNRTRHITFVDPNNPTVSRAVDTFAARAIGHSSALSTTLVVGGGANREGESGAQQLGTLRAPDAIGAPCNINGNALTNSDFAPVGGLRSQVDISSAAFFAGDLYVVDDAAQCWIVP